MHEYGCAMPAYEFVTRFTLRASPGATYAAMLRPLPWLQEVPYVREARLVAVGGADGVGAVHRGTVRAPLPYRLSWDMRTVEALPAQRVTWRAWGDLEGCASWQLAADGPLTHSTVTWRTRPTRAWMGRPVTLLQRALVWSHDRVMAAGVTALGRHLGSPVIDLRRSATRW